MTYRSKKHTDLLHEAPCFVVFPHTCNGPSVPCHSNHSIFGRGIGFKTPDWAVASACPEAHDHLDGRKGKWDRDTRFFEWLRAFTKTQDWLYETGRLGVTA